MAFCVSFVKLTQLTEWYIRHLDTDGHDADVTALPVHTGQVAVIEHVII